MGGLLTELVALALPGYFFLQLIMAARYRRGWRLAALAPLVLMLPMAVEAGLAYAAGVPGWVTGLVITAPVAACYLLALAILKGWRESSANGREIGR